MDGQGKRVEEANEAACDQWDNKAAEALVSLETIAPLRYRSRFGDGNLNGRSYGGQILGQAMMAATLSAPEDRPAAMLQLLFLRGADPTRRITFDAEVLQDGKRFSSRHIVGSQGDRRTVLSAQATFCAAQPGPRHAAPFAPPEDPESLPDLTMIPDELMAQLRPLGPYSPHIKPSMDFRIPEIERQLSAATAEPRLRFWIRCRQPLAAGSRAQAAVFAYLSDWWLNFSSVGGHLRDLQSRAPLYLSSLNHCIWFHRTFSPDAWMHVETESPCADGGRGLSIARVHDRDGSMLATSIQETLMVHPDGDA
ncbi:acyl-CoA thioesterase [Bradyrhizobium erythrophlei]|uniref:(3S)-malyl-CoA thioesterase n=1 Tax=Bradyrhizobium erythrophlei TaxID=1437360 RepID=A0A1H5HB56_9BRAD|nr:acyl-CoA thioesterase domain-containing protein [Bradyrhizobium erythrophlei]SEE25189.1 (3S)-malyl-CoA thioesterase [Bradyrhizobium erythrophlei]